MITAHAWGPKQGVAKVPAEHVKRIREELRSVGMTAYGLMKSESKYLPLVIHHDEHVGGVLYGQSQVGSVMLVATDQRIIYLDRKPFYTQLDEISYDVVSGVKVTQSGLFLTSTLHTKVQDFTLKYVNEKCATIFTRYVDLHRIIRPVPVSREQQGVIPVYSGGYHA